MVVAPNEPNLLERLALTLTEHFGPRIQGSQVGVNVLTLSDTGVQRSTQAQLHADVHPDTVLIMDARQWPNSGAPVQVQGDGYVVVVGAATVVATGTVSLVGNSGSQVLVMGNSADVALGGQGGDVLAGGAGNDQLSGDEGNDVLQGGLSDAGQWDIRLNAQGQLHVRYVADHFADAPREELGIWSNPKASGVLTDARFAWVYRDYSQLRDVALLVHALAQRLPTLSEMGGLLQMGGDARQVGEAAHAYWLAHIAAPGTQELSQPAQVAAVISLVWGEAQATDGLVQLGVDHLQGGGNWADIWLALARHSNHAAGLTDEQGQLRLIDQHVGQTGWAVGSGNDSLSGGAGNDVLLGGDGSDVLDGGEGVDVAVFFGSVADYEVALRTLGSTESDEVLVRHKASGEVDVLRSVEYVQYSGQSYISPDASALATSGGASDGTTFVALAGLAQAATVDSHLMGWGQLG